jgi:hypothetical protein
MKILYTLLLSAFCIAIQAQPVLNSSELMPFNTQLNYSYSTSFSVIDTSLKGAGQTWNFQTMQPDNSQGAFHLTVLNPASTPYGGNYPGANYCMRETPDTFYTYFNHTATTLERMGSVSTSGSSIYSDTQEEYVFPLQLGVTNNDTWMSNTNSFPGYYNLNCVGYGTLKLPNGTYSNALMVRVDFSNGFFDFPVFFWYSSDNGAMLLEYVIGDGAFVTETALYLTSANIGIDEHEVQYNLFYNNPVNDKLSVKLFSKQSTNMEYVVVNSLGEVLNRSAFHADGQSLTPLEINFDSYPRGIYFVRFMNDNGDTESMKAIKIIKQ